MASEPDNGTFFKKVLDTTPRWVIVLFSVVMGASVTFGFFLTTTGLQDPFKRVVDVYVKRLEISVDKLETAATDMKAIAARLESSEKGLLELSRSVSDIQVRIEDNSRRITVLELQLRGGKK